MCKHIVDNTDDIYEVWESQKFQIAKVAFRVITVTSNGAIQ